MPLEYISLACCLAVFCDIYLQYAQGRAVVVLFRVTVRIIVGAST